MAWRHSWPVASVTVVEHERPTVMLLPDLTPEEREELARRREDVERDARLKAALAEMERNQREAQNLLAQLKQELRFPLESVRVDADA